MTDVYGAEGLLRDLVDHAVHVARSRLDAEPNVVLLADPGPEEWRAANDAGCPVILVSSRPMDAEGAVDAVEHGAHCVVDAEASPDELVEAITTAADGGSYFRPDQVAALARALRARARRIGAPSLSQREEEILASIRAGDSVKQTALKLGIAPKTVENLQGRLYSKLAVRNRAQAVVRAHALGIGDPA